MFCTSHIHQLFAIQFTPKRKLLGENSFVRLSISKNMIKYDKRRRDFFEIRENFQCFIVVCASSVLSSVIDFDEIKFSKEIAEGSFGKVFKG